MARESQAWKRSIKISIALKIKIDTLINNDTAGENIRDIEKIDRIT